MFATSTSTIMEAAFGRPTVVESIKVDGEIDGSIYGTTYLPYMAPQMVPEIIILPEGLLNLGEGLLTNPEYIRTKVPVCGRG